MRFYFEHITADGAAQAALLFRFGDADGQLAADGSFRLQPGETFRNLSFEELAAASPGVVELLPSGEVRLIGEDDEVGP